MRIIQRSLELFASNIKLISQIVLTVWLPGSIVLALLATFVFPEISNGEELASFMLETRVANLIEFAFAPIYVGALIYALSQIEQGVEPTYQESIQYGIRQCFKLFVTRFSSSLVEA